MKWRPVLNKGEQPRAKNAFGALSGTASPGCFFPQANVAALGSRPKTQRFTAASDGRAGDWEARAAAGRHTEDDGNCVTYRQRACDL